MFSMDNFYSSVQETLFIKDGKLAFDPEKAGIQKVADMLKKGQPIPLGKDGDVTGKEQTELVTQPGKLAVLDPDKLKTKKVADMLKKGQPLPLGDGGDVTGKEQTKLVTQPGKLAAQWYQDNPQMLEDEKDLMRQSPFSDFELYRLNDGSLCWIGTLRPGIMKDIEWEVMAVYPNNYPAPRMGGSVRVYLRNPTVQNVHDALGYWPHHLINDGEGGRFLCTTRAEDLQYSRYSYSTAVTTLALAVKWLTALELVMVGELDENLFNQPDGI